MRNLLLFEAFKSIGITSLLKYLDNDEAERVKDELKYILRNHNYPIDKIKDEHISYDKLSSALKLIPEEGGKYIKFFYNRDNEFVSKTITKSESESRSIKIDSKKDKYNIEKRLKKDLNYKIPDDYEGIFLQEDVRKEGDYESLLTGDKVIALLGDEYYDEDYDIEKDWLVEDGTIFVNNDGRNGRNRVYIVHNNPEFNGGVPSGEESKWSKYGKYTWIIYDGRYVEEDHMIVALKKTDKKIFEYDYDTPNRPDYKHEEADWAITIKLSDILTEDYKDTRDVSSEREESREDALALKTDKDIRKSNQDRMNRYILSKMGIGKYVDGELVDDEKVILKNLQKIILTVIRSAASKQQYAYEYLYINDVNVDSVTGLLSNIIDDSEKTEKSSGGKRKMHIKSGTGKSGISRRDLEKHLYQMMDQWGRGYDRGYKSYFYDEISDVIWGSKKKTTKAKPKKIATDKDRLADKIGKIRKDSQDDIENFEMAYKSINTISKRTNVYKFFNAIQQMSKQIADYVRNLEIKTVEDLILLQIKLNSISTMLDRFDFNRNIGYVLDGRSTIDEVRITNKDIERLKIHKKYIDSILV